MIRIAVLGDIGSGKSYVAKQFGYPVFNADTEVAKLYRKSRRCYNKLKTALPEYIVSFPVKKIEISKAIIADQYNLKKIIKIVHPEVRSNMNSFIKKNPEIYKKIYLGLENNDHKNFLKSYELFVNYQDDDNLIKKINVNTLVTTGENDVGSTPEMARNLSKLIRDSKFVEIKKGKHLCGVECADDVNIIFKNFIDRNNV